MTVSGKLRQVIKMAAQNGYLPAVYHRYRNRPVDKGLVIFADAHHDSRPESMELLYQELIHRGMKIEEMYLDYQRHGSMAVLRHMTLFMKRYAQAGTVVICDNFLPAASGKKKMETRLVQLWHACGALKRFGYDTTEDIPAHYRGNVFSGTDLVTVSAPACIKPFAHAMRLPETAIQALGVSRTDVYLDETYLKRCRDTFRQDFPEAVGKKIVLWAPTFRGSPGKPEVIDLDLEKLQRRLGDNYLVLSSLHPHMHKPERDPEEANRSAVNQAAARKRIAGKAKENEYGRHQHWTTSNLLPVTDILIADYSSLIFEYLLMNKPLVLYVPDLEEYTAKRGFYLPYEKLPGLRVTQEDHLAQTIRKADALGINQKARQRFLLRYMSECDGHATQRIADWIEAQQTCKQTDGKRKV